MTAKTYTALLIAYVIAVFGIVIHQKLKTRNRDGNIRTILILACALISMAVENRQILETIKENWTHGFDGCHDWIRKPTRLWIQDRGTPGQWNSWRHSLYFLCRERTQAGKGQKVQSQSVVCFQYCYCIVNCSAIIDYVFAHHCYNRKKFKLQQFGYKESANEKKMKVQPDSQNRVFKLLSKKVDFIKFPIWFNFSVTWCFFLGVNWSGLGEIWRNLCWF